MVRHSSLLVLLLPSVLLADSAAERGKKALLGKAYVPPTMTLQAYENAWKHWGLKEKPAKEDYARLYRERYGLHASPFPNDGYPMGVRRADSSLPFGKRKMLTFDCLICHGGSIFGKSYVGLGNSSLDFHAFHEEMNAPAPRKAKPPFIFSNTRGTVEAGGMAVFLLGYREPNLSLRLSRKDLDLHDDLCEDTPAWWLLKKKKTMYYTGGGDVRSVRSIMQFMMSPLNFASAFDKAEPDFKDIREFILSIEAPKYPLAIDKKLASKGEVIFKDTCARCHGTYGANGKYPNKIIPLKEIGTDPRRFLGVTKKFGEYYNKSWFAKDHKALESDGYQAPPLDGLWATAPYLHNGCAPTVYDVLNSKTRPKIFTRSFRTGKDDYDPKKLGWKVKVLDKAPDPRKMTPIEFRKIYDTSKTGRSNGGHRYGDKLTDSQRWAVIEYLKTL